MEKINEIVSLKEYIEKIMDIHQKAGDKYFESRIGDVEKRIEQARVSMEKRLDGMNEFREALKDQSTKSPTRDEMNIQLDTVKKDVDVLRISKATLDGKASQNALLITFAFTIIGLVLSLLNLLSR